MAKRPHRLEVQEALPQRVCPVAIYWLNASLNANFASNTATR